MHCKSKPYENQSKLIPKRYNDFKCLMGHLQYLQLKIKLVELTSQLPSYFVSSRRHFYAKTFRKTQKVKVTHYMSIPLQWTEGSDAPILYI